MLAAVYRTTGGPEVLSVEEVPTPEPGPGEVRVRLRVAGVNPTDWKMRTTAAPQDFQVPCLVLMSSRRKDGTSRLGCIEGADGKPVGRHEAQM